MKKLFLILSTVLLAFSVFACTDKSDTPENVQQKPMRIAFDTLIQDSNGVHKCLWEDGGVFFNDFADTDRQLKKSAILNTRTDYDMWFRYIYFDLDSTMYRLPKFEYDETKFEIKTNPDKDYHFILTVLQACDNEKIIIKITDGFYFDATVDENGEPICPRWTINVTISAVE